MLILAEVKQTHKSLSQAREHARNRQRIVDAARIHFFNHGFRSVTMDDLAEELGISKKTLYAHFPGKFDLLDAVLADKLASVEATLKEVTRGHRRDFPATLQALLAGTRRELDEIKPPFVRDMRQKAPEVFKVVEHRRAALIQRYIGKFFIDGRRAGMVLTSLMAHSSLVAVSVSSRGGRGPRGRSPSPPSRLKPPRSPPPRKIGRAHV